MQAFVVWGLVLALFVGGCATMPRVKPSAAQVKTPDQAAQDREGCARLAAKSVNADGLAEGARTVGLVGLHLILLGAAEGANWGFLTGGSAADGAWIGAAVGAGIGTIVGLAVGVTKGLEQRREYLRVYEGCLGERGYSLSRAGV